MSAQEPQELEERARKLDRREQYALIQRLVTHLEQSDGCARTGNHVVEADADVGRQEYLDERKSLVQAELAVSDRYDASLLTLSAGALALSITFVHQIAPEPRAATVALIAWSWGLFAGAVAATLGSLFASQCALRRQRDILDSQEPQPGTWSLRNWAAVLTHVLNIVSLLSFLVGAALLAAFAWLNLATATGGRG